MVIPLARVAPKVSALATLSWHLLETPNTLILNTISFKKMSDQGAMVIPFARAAPKVGALATLSWHLLEAPGTLVLNTIDLCMPVRGLRYQHLL